MNKRIGIVISKLQESGPLNVMLNCIDAFSQSDYEFFWISLSGICQKSVENKILNYGQNIVLLKKGETLSSIIEQYSIDIVHSNCFRSSFEILKLKNIIRIATVHNNPYQDYIYLFGLIRGFLLAVIQMQIYRNLDRTIFCAEYLYRKFRLKNSCFIRNGCRINIIKRINTVNSGIVDFIYTGALSKRKNIISLVDAFLNTKIVYRLNIYGGGSEYLKIKKRIEKKEAGNKIVLHGYTNEIYNVLKKNDVYISMSKAEGLPNGVIEALCNGMPVILSNIDSHVELKNICPSCVDIVNVSDLGGYLASDGVVNLLQREKNYDEVKMHLSSSVMGKMYLNEYSKLLA